MNRGSLIMGGTFLVVAATLAVTITTRPLPQVTPTSAASPRRTGHSKPDASPTAARPIAEFQKPTTLNPQAPTSRSASISLSSQAHLAQPQTATPPNETGAAHTPPPSPSIGFSIRIPADHPEASRLAPMAQLVQSHANRTLERLTQQLGLSSTQREKLFPILAKSSESYDPAMQIMDAQANVAPSALTPENGELAMQEILTTQQQEERIDHAINDLLIWQEIIAGLERQLAEQSPQLGITTSAPETNPPPPPEPELDAPASTPRRNLFNSTTPNP
jgi:hypothetical protein